MLTLQQFKDELWKRNVHNPRLSDIYVFLLIKFGAVVTNLKIQIRRRNGTLRKKIVFLNVVTPTYLKMDFILWWNVHVILIFEKSFNRKNNHCNLFSASENIVEICWVYSVRQSYIVMFGNLCNLLYRTSLFISLLQCPLQGGRDLWCLGSQGCQFDPIFLYILFWSSAY